MKVKIFSGHNSQILQDDINKFLSNKSTTAILYIKQSESQLKITISIFYTE